MADALNNVLSPKHIVQGAFCLEKPSGGEKKSSPVRMAPRPDVFSAMRPEKPRGDQKNSLDGKNKLLRLEIPAVPIVLAVFAWFYEAMALVSRVHGWWKRFKKDLRRTGRDNPRPSGVTRSGRALVRPRRAADLAPIRAPPSKGSPGPAWADSGFNRTPTCSIRP